MAWKHDRAIEPVIGWWARKELTIHPIEPVDLIRIDGAHHVFGHSSSFIVT